MTTDEEIAFIETRLHGMSFGHIEYPILNQRLLTLRAAQKQEGESHAEQSRKESESKWYKKPLGLIFIGAASGILASCVTYLLYVHVGVRL